MASSGARSRAVLRRPGVVVAANVAVLGVAAALAFGAPERLPALVGLETEGSESARASDAAAAALGHRPRAELLLVTTGDAPVTSPVYAQALDVIESRVRADSVVAAVARGPVGSDRRTTVLEVSFDDVDAADRQEAARRIVAGIDPGPLRILAGGEAMVSDASRTRAESGLAELELLALPLVALVLVAVAGWRLALACALAAATGALGGVATLRLLAGVAELHGAAIATASGAAIVVGIEATLALHARHDGATQRRLVGSATVIAAALALTLFAVPVVAARSAAIAGAVATVLAGGAALLATPSLLALLHAEPGPGAGHGRGDAQGLARLARIAAWALERRPAAIALAAVVVAALGALSVAFLRDPETVGLQATDLPPAVEQREAQERLSRELGSGAGDPLLVTVPPAQGSELAAYRRELAGLGGVRRVGSPTEEPLLLELHPNAGTPLAAQEAVRDVRDLAAPPGTEVGGLAAESLDAGDAIRDRLGIAAALAALVSALACFAVSRLRVASALLGVATVLPAAATAGLVTLVFGEGRLESLLDYASPGAPHAAALLAVLAMLVAVSGLRTMTAAAALRDARRGDADFDAALGLFGPLRPPIAGSLVGALAFAVLLGGDLVTAKEVGFGIAAGLLLDLVAVRALLQPALARLALGDRGAASVPFP